MSLVTRFTLVWSALTAGVVAVFGFLSYRGGRQHLLDTWSDTLTHESETVVVKVQAAVDEAARDALYLAEKPGLREFVRARDNPAEQERWRGLLTEDFRALMAGKAPYFQVRLIGVADSGRELIRLDRTGDKLETITGERLQQKADREYFIEGLLLAPRHVHISDITLNQDFGRITEPHIPTLRTVSAVFDDAGAVFGLVVINVDMRGLLTNLTSQKARGVTLMLANARGDYLVHPSEGATFGTDLGRPARFEHETGGETGRSTMDLTREKSFPAAPGQGPRLQLRVVCPESEILGGLAGTRNQALAVTGLSALGGVGVVFLLGHWLARRLRGVGDAIARYETGADVSSLPPPGTDEIGQVAGKFREMADRVRDDVEKLAAARAEAEAATRMRDDFLAMMSHEIRTPMNALTGLLRVLERNRPAPHQEPVLASMRAASRNLMALLDSALDHSKIEAGKVVFEPVDFSLTELLADLRLTWQPLALQKGVALDIVHDDTLPLRIHADRVRMAQVLNNLLGNAMKFTDRGFVRLKASATDAAGSNGDADVQLVFTVADSGIGIAEENIGKIFAPFDQEHGDIGRRFGGTGLGLSIVRSLVQLQGGSLEVTSRKGEGSCFTVQLPARRASPAPLIPAEAIAPPDFSAMRILCVEDVASNREVMAAALEETGAQLAFAESGEAAMMMIHDQAFDLVLVDLQLPDMNGLDLARSIRAARPGLRMIAVTAQVTGGARAACREAGLSDLVAKPFAPETVWAAISESPPPAASLTRGRLDELFPREPERARRLAGLLGAEFAQAAGEFAAAAAAADVPALRRLRHRLHSALAQLRLDPLREALDRVIVSPDDAAAAATVTALLEQTAAALS